MRAAINLLSQKSSWTGASHKTTLYIPYRINLNLLVVRRIQVSAAAVRIF